jgi:hypothetical protein
MSLSELLPMLQTLPRADKMRLIHFLVVDLAREEGVPLVEFGTPYPIWSPYDAFGAAGSLLKLLDGQQGVTGKAVPAR